MLIRPHNLKITINESPDLILIQSIIDTIFMFKQKYTNSISVFLCDFKCGIVDEPSTSINTLPLSKLFLDAIEVSLEDFVVTIVVNFSRYSY